MGNGQFNMRDLNINGLIRSRPINDHSNTIKQIIILFGICNTNNNIGNINQINISFIRQFEQINHFTKRIGIPISLCYIVEIKLCILHSELLVRFG